MPQSIFIQVGQCGNQIGFRFWDLVLKEYEREKVNLCEEDVCHFLKPSQENLRSSRKPLEDCYKARAVLIDMEEGVIAGGFRGPLKKLFNRNQILTDVSGSGNNWAVGNKQYGRKYMDSMINLFRREAEQCDSLQCFFLTFSMGGGTGSGLGTAALEYLHSEFPKIPRLVFAVFPSIIDDVITSPYNAVLANSKLIEHANCVIPFENQALYNICINSEKNKKTALRSSARNRLNAKSSAGFKPFDDMNELISRTIIDLTSSSRFHGTLNIDLNDIIMNMTPYPRLHYLVPCISPLCSADDCCKVDQMFVDLFTDKHHLFNCSVKNGVFLSAAILCRGKITVHDVQNFLDREEKSFRFVLWNQNGWKLGLCDIPSVGYARNLLLLTNTTNISKAFQSMKEKFAKMYYKKAHLHHFSQVDSDINELFNNTIAELSGLIEEYRDVEFVQDAVQPSRLKVL